jgi:peptidoglycan/LPS O-acetylase OafA/YrhL
MTLGQWALTAVLSLPTALTLCWLFVWLPEDARARRDREHRSRPWRRRAAEMTDWEARYAALVRRELAARTEQEQP